MHFQFEDSNEDGEPEYVSAGTGADDAHYKAIREVAKPFERDAPKKYNAADASDYALQNYCDWSQENAAALVEEFAKRSRQ